MSTSYTPPSATSVPPSSSQASTMPSGTQETQALATQAAPGLDLLDGLASIAFAPGRAIIKQVNAEPTMKDLPMVILISLGFWYGCYWLWSSPSSPFNSSVNADIPKRTFKRKYTKPVDEDTESED